MDVDFGSTDQFPLPAGGALVLALLTAGLLAGCGRGAHASSPTNVISSALANANCMRSHDLDINPSSPAFEQAAQNRTDSLGSLDQADPASAGPD